MTPTGRRSRALAERPGLGQTLPEPDPHAGQQARGGGTTALCTGQAGRPQAPSAAASSGREGPAGSRTWNMQPPHTPEPQPGAVPLAWLRGRPMAAACVHSLRDVQGGFCPCIPKNLTTWVRPPGFAGMATQPPLSCVWALRCVTLAFCRSQPALQLLILLRRHPSVFSRANPFLPSDEREPVSSENPVAAQ